jgi:hypothetical protein
LAIDMHATIENQSGDVFLILISPPLTLWDINMETCPSKLRESPTLNRKKHGCVSCLIMIQEWLRWRGWAAIVNYRPEWYPT